MGRRVSRCANTERLRLSSRPSTAPIPIQVAFFIPSRIENPDFVLVDRTGASRAAAEPLQIKYTPAGAAELNAFPAISADRRTAGRCLSWTAFDDARKSAGARDRPALDCDTRSSQPSHGSRARLALVRGRTGEFPWLRVEANER